jgi:hypothetical protein
MVEVQEVQEVQKDHLGKEEVAVAAVVRKDRLKMMEEAEEVEEEGHLKM